MDMTSKYYINFVLYKCFFVNYSHGFSFHIMISVTVVPWWMHYNNQPWCLTIEPTALRSGVTFKKEKEIENTNNII